MCVHACAKQAWQNVGVPLRHVLVIKYNDTHMKDINTIIIVVFGVKAKGYVNILSCLFHTHMHTHIYIMFFLQIVPLNTVKG
jgi:hypothetical protein